MKKVNGQLAVIIALNNPRKKQISWDKIISKTVSKMMWT